MDSPETQEKTDSQAAAERRGDGKMQSAHKRTVRRSGEERRKEIAEVTLQLIASLGLQGATVSRHRSAGGHEAPLALRPLRQPPPDAARRPRPPLRTVGARLAPGLVRSRHAERLGEISEAHASFMTDEFEGFVIPLYEFITAPRNSG